MLKRNMGIVDRLIRTTLAIAVGILFVTDQITGIAAIILGVFALIFLSTSSVGFCPVYKVLGLSTLSRNECGQPGAEECSR